MCEQATTWYNTYLCIASFIIKWSFIFDVLHQSEGPCIAHEYDHKYLKSKQTSMENFHHGEKIFLKSTLKQSYSILYNTKCACQCPEL